MQNDGTSPLLELLSSCSTAVVYNAAFALYELAGSEAAAGLMVAAGAALHMKTACRLMQVRMHAQQSNPMFSVCLCMCVVVVGGGWGGGHVRPRL
jgi:hypothetical protein